MCLGIAKVHEETIPEQLGDMSIIALDDFGTDALIRTDHVPVVFGVELAESVVESTRSQNITVSWRRSASGGRRDLSSSWWRAIRHRVEPGQGVALDRRL